MTARQARRIVAREARRLFFQASVIDDSARPPFFGRDECLAKFCSFCSIRFFGFFVFVLLARFYLQLMRAPFRNPLGQFVTR